MDTKESRHKKSGILPEFADVNLNPDSLTDDEKECLALALIRAGRLISEKRNSAAEKKTER